MIESYSYDVVDVTQNGWAGVLATAAAIVVVMLALGLGLTTTDQRRQGLDRNSGGTTRAHE